MARAATTLGMATGLVAGGVDITDEPEGVDLTVESEGLDALVDSVGDEAGERVATFAGVSEQAAASRTIAAASAARRPSLIPGARSLWRHRDELSGRNRTISAEIGAKRISALIGAIAWVVEAAAPAEAFTLIGPASVTVSPTSGFPTTALHADGKYGNTACPQGVMFIFYWDSPVYLIGSKTLASGTMPCDTGAMPGRAHPRRKHRGFACGHRQRCRFSQPNRTHAQRDGKHSIHNQAAAPTAEALA